MSIECFRSTIDTDDVVYARCFRSKVLIIALYRMPTGLYIVRSLSCNALS